MDKVLVPIKLTDAMRERMGHIEDGPARSHDEVWAEILDAAFVQPRWSESFLTDLRMIRANTLAAHVLDVVGKYLDRSNDRNSARDCTRELVDLFYKSGVDIVTDEARAQAGLPQRGDLGWTREELQIMEAKRIEAMLSPLPPLIVAR